MGTVGWSRTSCLLDISEAPLPRGPRRHGGERGDRTPAGRHPGNGLAGRPITSLAALHRGHDGTRTRGLRLDRAASTPAAPRDHERAYPERDSNPQHPRSGRGASSSWTTRAWWTDPGSNRAREACKATLHTSAPPRASGRTRTDYLHGTKVAQVRTCFAGIGTLGRTRTGTGRSLEPLPPTVGLRGHARWERRIRTSTRLLQRQVSFPLDQLPIGRRGAGGRPPAGRTQRAARAAHDGACGVIRSGIRASAGVLSPLRWLHGPHAATVLRQVFFPPRDRGRTWSMVVA